MFWGNEEELHIRSLKPSYRIIKENAISSYDFLKDTISVRGDHYD